MMDSRRSDVDRDKALEMALGQIEKQFGKGSIMRMGEHGYASIGIIPTGSISLDLALGIGGGSPGRGVGVFGPPSPGENTTAVRITAATHRRRGGGAPFSPPAPPPPPPP